MTTHDASSCAVCAMAQTAHEADLVWSTDRWVAGILPGFDVPGWIVVALRRHAVGPVPFDAEDAAEFGGVLDRVSRALVQTTGAERVYIQGYGEREPHWHVLLSARGPEVPAEHRSIHYFEHREQYRDPVRAREVADRVRVELGAGR